MPALFEKNYTYWIEIMIFMAMMIDDIPSIIQGIFFPNDLASKIHGLLSFNILQRTKNLFKIGDINSRIVDRSDR